MDPTTNATTITLNEPIDTETVISGKASDAEVEMTGDDAAWIITNAFIIFTMQTGFGLLESACVSRKNEVNIMVKNVVDIVFGGLTYWMFGYGLSFGSGPGTNIFCGVGSFFLDTVDKTEMGTTFTNFIFQLSFATTATTIVSGAMAERCNFNAYCIFSMLNTIVYCIPAGWLWGKHGFLLNLGVVDIAGSGGVHLVGGVSAFVSAIMLGPRHKRYEHGTAAAPMGTPTNAILGLFVLWWGWLSFNCGSSFGVTSHKWKYAARAAASTLTASFGGGIIGMFYSYFTKNGLWDVGLLINSILSALVAVTAGCSLYHPWEGIILGSISGVLTCAFTPLMDKMRVDDPVGAVAVHAIGGIWGMACVGLFPENDPLLHMTHDKQGALRGGGFYMLGVQMLACVCLSAWSALSTFVLLFSINLFIPIRMTLEEELLGADIVEHGVDIFAEYRSKVCEKSPEFSEAITHIEEGETDTNKNENKDTKEVNVNNSTKKRKKTPKTPRINGATIAPLYNGNHNSVKFAWDQHMLN